MMDCFGDKDTEILLLQNSERNLINRIQYLEKELAELRENQPRDTSNSYIPSNTAGMLTGVIYTNRRDSVALASVSGGVLFVDGRKVDSPCLIPPGSTVRADRGPEYTNFFAVMEYPTIVGGPSTENWREQL